MAHAIDDLAVMISADASGMRQDLQKAVGYLRNFGRQVEQTAAGIESLSSSPKVDAKATVAATRNLRSVAAEAAAAGKAGQAAWAANTYGLGAVRSAARGTADAIGAVAKVAAGVALAEIGIRGVGEAFGFVKESVKMAADIEAAGIAFEVFTGSADKAQQLLQDIREMSASTPFGKAELTAAARSLLAYGTTAEQVIPTLRVLGELASKDNPLSELTYLYGTANSSGRLNAVDMRQYQMRGIPVKEALSKSLKKDSVEVQQMIEDGKIGVKEHAAAFNQMVLPGGKFHGMMARQADTLHGTWNRALAMLDLVKLKLGQIIVEEAGLKDAAKDGAAFFVRVERGLDDIRPGIRLAGDLLKGAAQYANELAKSALTFASMSDSAFGAAFPGLRQAAADIREMAAGAKEFKIDQRDVVNAAADTAVFIITAGSLVADAAEDVRKGFEDGIVKPLQEVARTLRDIRGIPDVLPWGDKAKDRVIPGTEVPRGAPPRVGESADMIRKRWGDVEYDYRNVEALVKNGRADLAGSLDRARERREAFLNRFLDPAAAAEHLKAGRVPGLRGDPNQDSAARGERLAPFRPKDVGGGLRDMIGGIEKARTDALRNVESQQEREQRAKVAAGFKRVFTEAGKVADTFAVLRDEFGPRMLGTYSAAQADALTLARSRIGVAGAAAFGAAAFAPHLPPQGPIRPPDEASTEVKELAKQIKDEFAGPAKKFTDLDTNIRAAVEYKLVTKEQGAAYFAKEVQDEAHKHGIGGPGRLPDAAMVGSAEDARLLNRFRSGADQPQDVPSLLRQLITLADNRLSELIRVGKDVTPPPRAMP